MVRDGGCMGGQGGSFCNRSMYLLPFCAALLGARGTSALDRTYMPMQGVIGVPTRGSPPAQSRLKHQNLSLSRPPKTNQSTVSDRPPAPISTGRWRASATTLPAGQFLTAPAEENHARPELLSSPSSPQAADNQKNNSYLLPFIYPQFLARFTSPPPFSPLPSISLPKTHPSILSITNIHPKPPRPTHFFFPSQHPSLLLNPMTQFIPTPAFPPSPRWRQDDQSTPAHSDARSKRVIIPTTDRLSRGCAWRSGPTWVWQSEVGGGAGGARVFPALTLGFGWVVGPRL